MKVYLKDGSQVEVAEQSSAYDLALKLSEGLARVACACEINGVAKDLRTPLNEGDKVNILTFDHPEGKHAFWHSSSHLMAQAIKELYPEAQLAIGPAIENGFYYDIDREGGFTEADLPLIEARMMKLAKEDYEIKRYTLPREEAIAKAAGENAIYKEILIRDLPLDAVISFYEQGDFNDLCAGPHLMSTKAIKAVKLMSLAGAYWRGNEKNKMLTRIYGISFPKKSELDDYLHMLEEAKARDHRKIGKEMKLFMISDFGPGFPFFLPNGMAIRNTLLDYWRQLHVREGYEEVSSPVILNRTLWETSGHWDHYKANMYTTSIDEMEFAVKPMNCPGSVLLYQNEQHSYRDLPMRQAELGLVHRHEKSGQLHGLMRVRCFTQDDAHIFCTREQIRDEIEAVARLIDEVYRTFGFEYNVELSTRPENSMGSDEDWNTAEAALKEALDNMGLTYVVNEGDGAFYGPKIDFHLRDCIGRTWQCGTIQLDFQLPQRFELEYVGQDGEKHRPIMIHRVVLGSVERFMANLIEEFAGKFPLWIAPEQVRVLSISEKHNAYARSIREALKLAGFRATIDERDDKIGFKIRQASVERVPYMLVVGAQEEEQGLVTVRLRGGKDLGQMSLAALLERLNKSVAEKRLTEDEA